MISDPTHSRSPKVRLVQVEPKHSPCPPARVRGAAREPSEQVLSCRQRPLRYKLYSPKRCGGPDLWDFLWADGLLGLGLGQGLGLDVATCVCVCLALHSNEARAAAMCWTSGLPGGRMGRVAGGLLGAQCGWWHRETFPTPLERHQGDSWGGGRLGLEAQLPALRGSRGLRPRGGGKATEEVALPVRVWPS